MQKWPRFIPEKLYGLKWNSNTISRMITFKIMFSFLALEPVSQEASQRGAIFNIHMWLYFENRQSKQPLGSSVP